MALSGFWGRDRAVDAAVLLVAAWLRWPWPSPSWLHIDERAFIEISLGFWSGDLNPHFFNYPTLQFYLCSALFYLGSLVSAQGDSFLVYQYFVDPGQVIAWARGLAALMAVGTVAVCMRLGRRLYGREAGWAAGLLLGLMPLHTRFSHLAATDVPALLWGSLALLWAVRLAQEEKRLDGAVAGLWVGLAAATKYPAALAFLPVLAGVWTGAPERRLPRLAQAFAAASAAFVLCSPYVLLDWPAFEAAMVQMGGEHLVGQGHASSDSSLWHLLGHNLRYGMGWVGLAAALAALLWRPRPWRGDEWPLVAAFVAFALFAAGASSAFMRYALPLAPVLALLAVRLGSLLQTRFRWPWLAAALLLAAAAEPAHTSLNQRLLLGAPDTRDRARRALLDYGGAYVVHVPDLVGQVRLVSPVIHYKRQRAFLQRFGLERLLGALEELSRHPGLPPFYTTVDIGTLDRLVAPAGEAAPGKGLVLQYSHPFGGAAVPPQAAGVLGRVDWKRQWEPGGTSATAYDPVDWYFVPVGGWGGVSSSGPGIRLGELPLRLPNRVPTAQEFYALLYRVLRADQASGKRDWNAARPLYEAIEAVPYELEGLLSGGLAFNLHVGRGLMLYETGDVEGGLESWLAADRLMPGRAFLQFNIATAYAGTGRLDEAASRLEAGLRLESRNLAAYRNLGAIYRAQGRDEAAVALWEAALAVLPSPEICLLLVEFYVGEGRIEEARAYVERALLLVPGHGGALDWSRRLGEG